MKRTWLATSFIAVLMCGSVVAQTGFNSISFIWNEDSWTRMTSFKPPEPNPALEAALRAPKRITFIYNAWHLPGLVKDIRIQDLERHVLGRPLVFETKWPQGEKR